jgi:hypothetical protein
MSRDLELARHANHLYRTRFPFFFYSNEGIPREPMHVHVEKDGRQAKFWLNPQVQLAYNDGYDGRTLRELIGIVAVNRLRIEGAWNDFFS